MVSLVQVPAGAAGLLLRGYRVHPPSDGAQPHLHAQGGLPGPCRCGCRHAVCTHAVGSHWAAQLWWLNRPRHASRPSVCRPAHGILHFGMLPCAVCCAGATQQLGRSLSNAWVASRAPGSNALITAQLAPWPPFCAAGELPQADGGQGRPQVRGAAGVTAAVLPRLHCWWPQHRRNNSVRMCAGAAAAGHPAEAAGTSGSPRPPVLSSSSSPVH